MSKDRTARWWIVPGLSVLALAALASIYFFDYVPAQERFFTSRNLRVLAFVGERVRATLGSLPGALAIAVQRIEGTNVAQELTASDRQDRLDKARDEVIRGMRLVRGLRVQRVTVNTNDSARLLRGESSFSIKSDVATSWLQARYRGPAGTNQGLEVIIEAKGDLDPMLDPAPEFDGLLLAQKTGEVLFQRCPAGFSLHSLQELADQPGKPVGAPLVTEMSQVRPVRLGGTPCKLFLNPLYVDVTMEPGQTNDWVVAGFVATDRFAGQCRALPHIHLIFFMAGLLFCLLSLPFLNVRFASRTERLRRRDIRVLLVCLVSGGLFLTVLALDSWYYNQAETQLIGRLKVLAADLARNFQSEVSALHRQLVDLDRAKTNWIPTKQPVQTGVLTNARLLPEATNAPYPYFQIASWVSNTGKQLYKASIRDVTSPLLDLNERAYFRDARHDRASVYAYRESGTNQFWLEPIYPLYGGDNSVVLALRTEEGIATLDARLQSVIQPVLPPTYGFAIITPEGRVLFHSDPRRNLRENLFDECEQDPVLRRTVASRVTNEFEIQYYGRPHHFVARPLEHLPWTLLVFRDERLLSGINLDIVLSTLALLALFYGLPLVVLLAFYGLHRALGNLVLTGVVFFLALGGGSFVAVWGTGESEAVPGWFAALVMLAGAWGWLLWKVAPYLGRGDPSWYWPAAKRTRRYCGLFLTHAVTALLLIVGMVRCSNATGLVWLAALGAGLGPMVTYWVLQPGPAFPSRHPARPVPAALRNLPGAFARWVRGLGHWALRQVNGHPTGSRALVCRVCYTLGFWCLLFLVAVVPALACFKISHVEGQGWLAKHGLFHLSQAFIDRRSRIETEMEAIPASAIRTNLMRKRLAMHPGSGTNPGGLGPWDICTDFLYGSSISPGTALSSGSNHFKPLDSWFSDLFEAVTSGGHERYRQAAMVLKTPGADGACVWAKLPDRLVVRRLDYPGDEALVLSASVDALPARLSVPILALVAALLCLPVGFVARRLWLAEVEPAACSASQVFYRSVVEQGQHVLVLEPGAPDRPPLQTRLAPWIPQGRRPEELFDLREWAEPMDGEAPLRGTRRAILIDRLESHADDPASNRRKLEWLEKLLARSGRPVALFSTVDPFGFRFPEPIEPTKGTQREPPGPTDAERWARLLQGFKRVYGVPAESGGTEADYRAIWATCTQEEQIALYQLATEGLIRAQHPALPVLLGRGLIDAQPHPRFRDAQFREFVRAAMDQEILDRSEEQAGRSHWSAIRNSVQFGLLAVALVLFFTQQEMLNKLISLITALTTSLPTILRLVGSFEGAQRTHTTEPGD